MSNLKKVYKGDLRHRHRGERLALPGSDQIESFAREIETGCVANPQMKDF